MSHFQYDTLLLFLGIGLFLLVATIIGQLLKYRLIVLLII